MSKAYFCKYDTSHTQPFPDPGSLGRHYAQEHPEHVSIPAKSKKIYTCRACGYEAKWPSGMRNHVIAKHPALVTEPYHRDDYADARDAGEQPKRPRGGVAVNNGGTAVNPVVRQHARTVQHHWEVDDIVLPVITQLAKPASVVPIDKLPALFAWRDATAQMLDAVQ